MAVFNGELFLEESINSILTQTFTSFEFIIIDDGSHDRTSEIIRSFRDPRIRYIQNIENLGLTKSLNIGLKISRSKYIARMDADDISLSHRLRTQYDFLEANPDIIVVGAFMDVMHSCEKWVWRSPVEHEKICCRMLFANALYHPTVMLRREKLHLSDLRYNDHFRESQDYDLWSRVISTGGRLANLNEVLVQYRMHEGQIGKKFSHGQKANALIVMQYLLEKITAINPPIDLPTHLLVCSPRALDREQIKEVYSWIEKLRMKNAQGLVYSPVDLVEELSHRWNRICYLSTANGLWLWFFYQTHCIGKNTSLKFQKKEKMKFFIKCLFNR